MCYPCFVSFFSKTFCRLGSRSLARQSWPIIPGSSASSLADVVVPSPQGWIKWWRKIMSHSGLHVWYMYLPWTVGFYGKFIGKIHKCPMDANGCVNKKSEFQEWSQVKQPCLHKAKLYPLVDSWSTACSRTTVRTGCTRKSRVCLSKARANHFQNRWYKFDTYSYLPVKLKFKPMTERTSSHSPPILLGVLNFTVW